MEDTASYQIFRKETDNTTVLVEAVKGLDEARKRVHEMNGSGSGEHFIFDPSNGKVIEPSRLTVPTDPFAV